MVREREVALFDNRALTDEHDAILSGNKKTVYMLLDFINDRNEDEMPWSTYLISKVKIINGRN